MYYNYVLQCVSESGRDDLYIGYTTDLKSRITKHKSGSTKTTKKFKRVDLIYYEACLSEKDARRRELQMKTGFGRGYIKRRLENFIKDRDAGMV